MLPTKNLLQRFTTDKDQVQTDDAALQATFEIQPALIPNYALNFYIHFLHLTCHEQVGAAAAQADLRHQLFPQNVPQVDWSVNLVL